MSGTGPQGHLEDDMDRYLTNKASAFRYPPTPDIASAVRSKLAGDSLRERRVSRTNPRRAWVAMSLMLLLVLGAIVAVPQVRAFVNDIYIGVVRIVRHEPGLVPVPNVPTPTPLSAYDPKLVGKTDLGNAELMLNCRIKLPTKPEGLGLPDNVYYQVPASTGTVILVWTDPAHPTMPRMALYIMPSSTLVNKTINVDGAILKVQVNGQSAYWVSGPHMLEFFDATGKRQLSPAQLVEGNVLIWTETSAAGKECSSLTYRLETNLSSDEAVAIAESLKGPDVMPTPVPTNTPMPTTTPVSPAANLNLDGETVLSQLGSRAGFRVKIPVVPERPELVAPSKIYLQDLGGPAVIMAWYAPDRTDDLQLVLYQFKGSDKLAGNTAGATRVLQQTTVHGKAARWLQGPHVVSINGGNGPALEAKSFITDGHTLAWEEDGVAYRLETPGTMQEAVRIAESLK